MDSGVPRMRRKVRGVLAGVLAALSAVALAGCGLLSTGNAEGPFVGDWKLVDARWGAGLELPRTGITLVSDGDSVSGFSGCHECAFELSGKPEEFEVGRPLEHGPSGPATGDFGTCNSALDRIEARYLTALLAAESAEVRDGALVLTAGYSYLR